MEILFIIGFFSILLLTGVTAIGVVVALMLGTLLMVVGSFFWLFIKLLPWLILAAIVAWLIRRNGRRHAICTARCSTRSRSRYNRRVTKWDRY